MSTLTLKVATVCALLMMKELETANTFPQPGSYIFYHFINIGFDNILHTKLIPIIWGFCQSQPPYLSILSKPVVPLKEVAREI